MVEGKGQGDLRHLSYHTSFDERVEIRSAPPPNSHTLPEGERCVPLRQDTHGVKQEPSKEELMSFRVGGRGVRCRLNVQCDL